MLDITMKYIHIMLMYILMSILFSASKPVHPNTIKQLQSNAFKILWLSSHLFFIGYVRQVSDHDDGLVLVEDGGLQVVRHLGCPVEGSTQLSKYVICM